MKKILIILGLFLLTQTSYARTRWYRINPETVTSDGLAIAWGVRDVPVDFEAVEQTDESIEAFLNKYDNMFVNFLVDVERETILSEIPSQSFFGRLGNYSLGNHYSVTMVKLQDVPGLGENQSAILLSQNWKWDNFFSDVFIIEKNSRTTTLKKHYDLKDVFRDEINKKLNWVQRQTLYNKALLYNIDKSEGERIYKLSVSGYIPKCTESCETISIVSDVELNILPEEFQVQLKNLKYQKEQQ